MSHFSCTIMCISYGACAVERASMQRKASAYITRYAYKDVQGFWKKRLKTSQYGPFPDFRWTRAVQVTVVKLRPKCYSCLVFKNRGCDLRLVPPKRWTFGGRLLLNILPRRAHGMNKKM